MRDNEAYLVIVLLTRVITSLGDLDGVTPRIVENMFAADIAFLQDFYQQINELEDRAIVTVCPNCNHEYEVGVPFLGEY